MNEKISTHRKRVSDSAQKLAGILELDGNGGDYSGMGMNTRRNNINSVYNNNNDRRRSSIHVVNEKKNNINSSSND